MSTTDEKLIALVCAAMLLAAASSCKKQAASDETGAAVRVASDLAQPGAEPFDVATADRLRDALAARGPDYRPRTRHLRPDGAPVYMNRLLLTSSPYLQQHAHNPVNWYPWGEEAFADAKRLGRMILLSVGYSTCHWCHVMEEESFEDVEIASYLNANYIAIKVDREELPDVDSLYMTAVTRSIGRGGWPMTVWLTPDREPIHGETYLPPRTGVRGNRLGFLEMLQRFKSEYEQDPTTIAARSQKLTRDIQDQKTPLPGGAVEKTALSRLLHQMSSAYSSRFDREHGGMRGRPKFPSSFPVRLLLRLHRRTGDAALLEMATHTLEKMAAGGIYDHIGGGFHRYAVDERWLVPHFEKMLYDNALLTVAYLEGHQASGREDFAAVAREILQYVSREMTSPEGAFYSATDADSLDSAGHREEGAFFVWRPQELSAVLDPDSYALAKALFAVTARGNFEGKNVLHRPRPLAVVAAELDMELADAQQRLQDIKAALYQERAKRAPPLRDDKILVAWNGLMISAFARAAVVLDRDAPHRSEYLQRARRAADFILEHMRDGDGLWRSYMDGKARIPGYLDDYAFFINGLLDIFEAGGGPAYLEHAIALDKVVRSKLEDGDNGAFFLASTGHDQLLTREKPMRDGAIPSGNSLAVRYLLRLYEMTSDTAYMARAERALGALSGQLFRAPTSLAQLLIAVDFWTDMAKEVVIVAPEGRDQAAPFSAVLGQTFLPNGVVSISSQAETEGPLGRVMPLVRQKVAQRDQVTAYVCEQQICELPTRDPAEFARQLGKVFPLVQ